jgi:CheY-like chemotaxis protein
MPQPASFTILCVDEEETALTLLQNILAAAANHVFTAFTGESALNILRQTAIDIVVLGYGMSSMDGLALALEIKRLRPAMPIVVFSAKPEQVPERLRRLASEVVDKQRPLTDLTAAVDRALSQNHSSHAVRAYPRFNVDLRVLLTSGGAFGHRVFWITARSLGEGGLGADVPVRLGEDDTVLLDLMLSERLLTVPSSVRYHSGHFHGFQFIDITDDQRAAIRQYCECLLLKR